MLPCLKVYELTFPFRTKVVERQDFILFTVSPALGKCSGCNKFTKLFAEWMNESLPQVHAFLCLMLFLVRFVLLVSVKGYCLEYRIWFWGLSLLFVCKYPIHIMLQCCLLPSFHVTELLLFVTDWPSSPHGRRICACVLSHFSHVQLLLVSLWTIVHQAPLSMGCSRQEYWSGLPCPPPGDLPDPVIEPMSLMSPALAGRLFTTSAILEALAALP